MALAAKTSSSDAKPVEFERQQMMKAEGVQKTSGYSVLGCAMIAFGRGGAVMKDYALNSIASAGLVLGGACGIAGTFAPSAALRGLLWGIDGCSLLIAVALLALIFLRAGHDLVVGGFLVFAFGQCLVLATAAMPLDTGAPVFGAGTALWAAGLVLISLPRSLPMIVRILGLAAAIMLAVPAVEILLGEPVTALTRPLPFVAYPVLVATMLGWAWTIWQRPPVAN